MGTDSLFGLSILVEAFVCPGSAFDDLCVCVLRSYPDIRLFFRLIALVSVEEAL